MASDSARCRLWLPPLSLNDHPIPHQVLSPGQSQVRLQVT